MIGELSTDAVVCLGIGALVLAVVLLRAERRRRSASDRFSSLIAELSDAIVVRDADGCIRWGSPSTRRVFGYEPEDMVGTSILDLVHPDDLEQAVRQATDATAGVGSLPPYRVRARHRDGTWRTVDVVATNLLDDPHVRGVVLNISDVTDEHRARLEQRRSEQRFRIAFDHAPSGLALVDPDGVVVDANSVLVDLLGLGPDEVVGCSVAERFGLADDDGLRAGATWQQAVRGRRRDDERILLHRATAIEADGDTSGGFLLESTDITEEVRERHRLEWQATHDALTGLANRSALLDRLGRDLSTAEPADLVVLLVDLDGFKAINDELGHHVGDAVLVEVAARLEGMAREGDLVVRLGGDEFVVVATAIGEDGAQAMAERMVAVLSAPFAVDGVDATVGASVGHRVVRPDDSPEAVLVDADVAMYRGKRRRRFERDGARAVPAELPANEAERLAALHALHLVDTEGDPTVQAITRLAAQICGTPMAAVTLIDASRQWLLAEVGLDVDETSRDDAFCAHTILDPEVMVVPDADLDDRFATNRLVLGDPYVRFYAGAPLEVAAGTAIGALCVLDDIPRDLSPDQLASLQDLSKLLVDHLAKEPGYARQT